MEKNLDLPNFLSCVSEFSEFLVYHELGESRAGQ